MNNIIAFRLFLHLCFRMIPNRGEIFFRKYVQLTIFPKFDRFAKGRLKLGNSLYQTDGNLMQFATRMLNMSWIGQNQNPQLSPSYGMCLKGIYVIKF